MCRSWTYLGCAFVVMLAAHVRADDKADARAIIDKAIEFVGGKEGLAKYDGPFECTVRVKSFGQQKTGAGTKLSIQENTMRSTTWFPDRYRREQEITSNGNASTTYDVLNGDKYWAKRSKARFGNMPPPPLVWEKLNPAETKYAQGHLYRQSLATLWPLRQVDFQLATVDEITLENRPAIGVTVSKKDQTDVRLYFDKETFALVKLAYQPSESNATYEEYFDDYTQLDELVYPGKSVVFIRGTKLHEKEITELKFIEPPADDFFDQS